MAIQDSRFDSLRAQGFTGANDDMMLQWAQAAGATSNHVNDAVLEALLLNGATTACLSDAWVEYLISIGGNGTRNDMEDAFWESGGIIDPVPPIPPDPVQDHLDRVSDTSDATWVTDITTLIDTLVALGIWDKLTDLSVPHNNSADSLLGIKGTQDSTAINAPEFNRAFGFRVGNDGQNRFIDTNIRRVVNPLVIDNDAMSGFVYRVASSLATAGLLGSMGSRDNGDDAFIIGIIDATNSFASMGNAGNTVTSPFGGNGFLGASRTSAITNDIIKDTNASASTTASTGGAPDVNTIVVGGIRTDGVFSTGAGTEDMIAWGIGGALTTQNLVDLNNAIEIYVAARIAEAPPIIPPVDPFDTHWARVTDKANPALEPALRTLFADLQSNGLYDKLDELCVNHQTAADAVLGLKGVQDSVEVGSPSYGINGGFLCGDLSGVERYIDTGLRDTGSTQFSDDSMTMFIYRRFVNQPNSGDLGTMGASDGGGNDAYIGWTQDATVDYRMGHAAPSDTLAIVDNRGFFAVTRNSATTGAFVYKGVTGNFTHNSTAGTPKTNAIYAGGFNNQGAYEHAIDSERVNAWGIGGGLTEAELGLLDGIIVTYLTAINNVP